MKVIEKQIKELDRQTIEGVKIRSRATWLEKGEKPTRFFFNLERVKQSKGTIEKLQSNNAEITNTEQILEETRVFYQNLYTPGITDKGAQDEFLANITAVLGHHQSGFCEGLITESELKNAVHKLKANKAPGPDGLPGEFYKHFWAVLEEDLCELFNVCYALEGLTASQQMAILRLL